jgi:hypothetical protein
MRLVVEKRKKHGLNLSWKHIHFAAGGFYFTNQSDIVRCAFCGVEVGCWEKGQDALKEH